MKSAIMKSLATSRQARPQLQESAPAQDPDATALSLRDRYRLWRNRMIGSPAFRAWSARLPILRGQADVHANDLFRITSGFIHSQILFALLDSGVIKRLHAAPANLERLAQDLDLPAGRLERMMEAAQGIDLLCRLQSGKWALADHGTVIATDPGIEAMIRHHAMLYEDLRDPVALLRNGGKGSRTHSFWAYAGEGRQVAGEDAASYSQLMASSQSMLAQTILDAYPFHRHEALLDVGAGNGAFLIAAGKRNPALQLNGFDLPQVAALGNERLAQAGLAARAKMRGGDFFSGQIAPACDLFTLVRVVCDHDDERVVRLLANIRRAMPPGARLLIAEAMQGPATGQKLAHAYFSVYFLAMASGQCRSPQAIGELLRRAGFRHWRTAKTASPLLASLVIASA